MYASLLRRQQRRWISSAWDAPEDKRKTRFRSISRSGRKQLAPEAGDRCRMAEISLDLLRLGRP